MASKERSPGAIDEHRLLRLASRTDVGLGIRESFVRLPHPTAGGSIVGVVAEPVGRAGGTGWVLCHSFGIEQMHLSTMEARIARAVASAGSPTLRVHGYGYGDSDGDLRAVSLETHAGDVLASVRALADRGLRVGLIGMRFGASVAARVASRSGVTGLALIEPALTGPGFLRDLLRSKAVAEMAGDSREEWLGPGLEPGGTRSPGDAVGPSADGTGRGSITALRTRGWLDVRGFPLSLRAHEQIMGLDLEQELDAASVAHLLLVWLSTTASLTAAKRDLGERLARRPGAEARTVVDRGAADLGGYHYRFEDDRRQAKVDSQLDLTRKVAALVASWTAGSGDDVGRPTYGATGGAPDASDGQVPSSNSVRP